MKHNAGFTHTFTAGEFLDDMDDVLWDKLFNAVENMNGDGTIPLQFNFSFEMCDDIKGIELDFENTSEEYSDMIMREFVINLPVRFIIFSSNQLYVLKLEVERLLKHFLENDAHEKAMRIALDYRNDMACNKADMRLDELKERKL